MKTRFLHIRLLFYSFFLLGLFPLKAQQQPGGVHFKGGIYRTQRNFGLMRIQPDSLRKVLYKQRYYVLVQFDQLPDSIRKTELAGLGIRLFDYLPDRAYLAEVRDSIPVAQLGRYAVSSISQLPSDYKIARRLQEHLEEDLRDQDKVIAVSWFGSQSIDDIRQEITAAGAIIVPEKIQPPHILFVRASNAATLNRLAALPFVSYLASQSIKPRPLNFNNRAAHGADALGAISGRNLQGDGIVVGVGDNSSPYTHVDFTGRL
ncbi:MAG: peptidase S8, partial [Bacteroidetes bacterium]|nr:peptidase S8 [Bacteroidota bacterium]